MIALRVQARRRLIGTAILLLVGVILLSVVLDNSPRPLPADLQVRLAKPSAPESDGASVASASIKAAHSAEGQVAPANLAAAPISSTPPVALEGGNEAPRGASPVPAQSAEEPAKNQPALAETASSPVANPQPSKPSGASSPTGNETTNAKGKSAATDAAAPGTTMGRFVIQLGAFSDEAKIRALRAKVERLGLKTYTQQVGQADARRTRVRIGPYSSRQDAEQTVSKLKAQGLTAVVLTL